MNYQIDQMSMKSLPQRKSMVSQTAELIRAEIRQGTWRKVLPGERVLCASLQVSRNTLRSALAQIKLEGLIRSAQGSRTSILRRPSQRTLGLRSQDVGLLSPLAIERLRPSQTLWIDELRAMLSERNCRLHMFYGQQYVRAKPAAALEKLLAQHPHRCWVLTLSSEGTQYWFEQKGVPCVVAGSIYPGVNLPFRDLDHRAICRHAAGLMLGQGHRKIALLIQKSRRAGDLESELGFFEGVRLSPDRDAAAVVGSHDATIAGICAALRRLMEQKPAPTALLVANAYHYLTVVGWLAQMGWRVPQDVSVVSRDEDPFLSFLVPTPAHYSASPHIIARTLLRPVVELLAQAVVTQRSLRIMPEFIRGETLARMHADAG
jgi:LacI family transcriptional regulator